MRPNQNKKMGPMQQMELMGPMQKMGPIVNYPADEDKDDHNDDDQAFDSVKTAIFSVLFV